jgi:carbamate kinase
VCSRVARLTTEAAATDEEYGRLVGQRTVIALGGNAISPAGRAGTAAEQTANLWRSMVQVAQLVAEGTTELVLTHGNGPQVGNLLIKNELARDVVPPVPLDWCVAQTQSTIGFTIASTLGYELARRGVDQPVVPVVSRVLVADDDPAFDDPSKPVGPFLEDPDEVARREDEGQHFVRIDGRGWRRVVPSPHPIASLDRAAVQLLLDDGAIVIANGGGGIPVVEPADAPLRGVEAVIDKDLASALLAEELGASVFAILTDVGGVAIDHRRDTERWLDEVTVDELRRYADERQFARGSMGPKVEAVCRFVESTGGTAVIAALDQAQDAVHGRAGTRVSP